MRGGGRATAAARRCSALRPASVECPAARRPSGDPLQAGARARARALTIVDLCPTHPTHPALPRCPKHAHAGGSSTILSLTKGNKEHRPCRKVRARLVRQFPSCMHGYLSCSGRFAPNALSLYTRHARALHAHQRRALGSAALSLSPTRSPPLPRSPNAPAHPPARRARDAP